MTTQETATRRRGRGPNDPDRRNRIARAAISVIADRGIGALTHRAVAAEAGVPLGSTTYHFATLDDLIAVALDEAARLNVAALREWDAALESDTDLASALTDLVLDSVTQQRASTIAEYNLYALALQRPDLRGAAVAWDNALAELFVARTDPLTGRMIAMLTCGLMMQAVLGDTPPHRDDVEALYRRALQD
ncbi:TetR/AcrR family transcriptional regulator [Saccharomonospora piscinae]|uniref:TetR family transcriptional regulator n=1 Tax=Saccharomonospora piscinae TaxID=687388 RepID=A0A1V9A5Q2_SACPI|nr:TetR family transcriptional regulator [Saccharomonospora piscinae]OQO92459.1 TetR family transcriptional regulator [Saccharomonospora piscinae]TLW91834.1 TetR family transcriptional regulator [Saccharomonospora piscinae]